LLARIAHFAGEPTSNKHILRRTYNTLIPLPLQRGRINPVRCLLSNGVKVGVILVINLLYVLLSIFAFSWFLTIIVLW